MLLVSNVFLIGLTVLCKINENGAETQNLNSRERNIYENREVLKKLVELLNRNARTNTNSDETVISILDGIDIRNSDEMKAVMKHLQKNYDYKEVITEAIRLNDARIHIIENPEVLDDFVKELDRTESSMYTRTPGILESTVRRYGEFGLGKGGAISEEAFDNRGSKRHKILNQRNNDDKTKFDSRERFDNRNNYKKKNYFDHRDNYDNYDKKNNFEAREKYSSYNKKSFEKVDSYNKKSNFDNVDSYNKKNNFEKRDTFDGYDKRNNFRNKERYENKEKYNIKEKYDSKPKYDNKEKYGDRHYSSSEKFNKREKYNPRDNFDSREKYGTKKRNSNQERDKTSFRTNKNLSSRIRSRDDDLDTPSLKIPDHDFEKPKVISFDLGKSDEHIKKKMDGPLRDNFYVSKKTTKEWRDSLERRKKPEKADNDHYNNRPAIRLPNKGLDWSEVGVEKKTESKKYYEDDMPGNRGVMKPMKAFDWSEVGNEKSTSKKKYFDDDFTKRKENVDEFTAQFAPAFMEKKTTDTTPGYSFSTRKQSDDWEQPALHYENKYKNNIEKLYQYDYSPKKRPVIRNDGYGFSFGRTPIPFVGKRAFLALTECRKYDIDGEAQKLYGEDLDGALKRFRKSYDYLQILTEKKAVLELELWDSYIYITDFFRPQIEQKVKDMLGIKEEKTGEEDKPIGRQNAEENAEEEKTDVQILDEHMEQKRGLTVQEINTFVNTGFEFAGKKIHGMISSLGGNPAENDEDIKSTMFGGDADKKIMSTKLAHDHSVTNEGQFLSTANPEPPEDKKDKYEFRAYTLSQYE